MADAPVTQDPPSPPPPAGGPDEATVKGWISEAIAEALAGDEPEPEPIPKTPKADTAREREAIAEAAAAKAVAAIKAAEPTPPKLEEVPPPVEPAKKTRFRAAANRFWGEVDEAVSGK